MEDESLADATVTAAAITQAALMHDHFERPTDFIRIFFGFLPPPSTGRKRFEWALATTLPRCFVRDGILETAVLRGLPDYRSFDASFASRAAPTGLFRHRLLCSVSGTRIPDQE
jgi:hypothetical protein